MSSRPILVIKDTDSTVAIRARMGEEFSEHEIQLSVMLAYYHDNDLPVIENLIDLFESVVKRTISEVIPHDNLFLTYDLITDDELSQATDLEIDLIEVKVDDVLLRLDGKILALKGLNDDVVSDDLKPKVFKRVEKNIPTKKKISFKEFTKQQKELGKKNKV